MTPGGPGRGDPSCHGKNYYMNQDHRQSMVVPLPEAARSAEMDSARSGASRRAICEHRAGDAIPITHEARTSFRWQRRFCGCCVSLLVHAYRSEFVLGLSETKTQGRQERPRPDNPSGGLKRQTMPPDPHCVRQVPPGPRFSDSPHRIVQLGPGSAQARPRSGSLMSIQPLIGRIWADRGPNCTLGCGESEHRGGHGRTPSGVWPGSSFFWPPDASSRRGRAPHGGPSCPS